MARIVRHFPPMYVSKYLAKHQTNRGSKSGTGGDTIGDLNVATESNVACGLRSEALHSTRVICTVNSQMLGSAYSKNVTRINIDRHADSKTFVVAQAAWALPTSVEVTSTILRIENRYASYISTKYFIRYASWCISQSAFTAGTIAFINISKFLLGSTLTVRFGKAV
jgi:hypothetical protein